jgi:Domain of unknown function (DUF4124)
MRAVVLSALLATLLVAGLARAEIYRWVDAKGRTNFADNIEHVPESQRATAKVFRAKARPATPEVDHSGPTQAAFARALATDLGLVTHENQDPVSILQIVGVYPGVGWYPAATLLPAVVDEVTRATVAAARAHRLPQSPASAEASVLRTAEGLGVKGPPPSVVAEPLPPPPPPEPIVVAPNIIVEAPPPTVVVQEVAPAAASGYFIGSTDPAFAYGVPFRPFHPSPSRMAPLSPRIPPLSDPGGHLRGPVIEPFHARSLGQPPSLIH